MIGNEARPSFIFYSDESRQRIGLINPPAGDAPGGAPMSGQQPDDPGPVLFIDGPDAEFLHGYDYSTAPRMYNTATGVGINGQILYQITFVRAPVNSVNSAITSSITALAR